jgi:hypothetical protein
MVVVNVNLLVDLLLLLLCCTAGCSNYLCGGGGCWREVRTGVSHEFIVSTVRQCADMLDIL